MRSNARRNNGILEGWKEGKTEGQDQRLAAFGRDFGAQGALAATNRLASHP
jgi:hypothetical protein